MHEEPIRFIPLDQVNHLLNLVIEATVEVNRGISPGQTIQRHCKIKLIEHPGRGVGIGNQNCAMGREKLGKISDIIPDRNIIPDQSDLLAGKGACFRFYSLLQFFFEFFIITDCPPGSPERHDGSHMDEGVKSGNRSGMMAGKIEDLFPQGDGLKGPGGYLFKTAL